MTGPCYYWTEQTKDEPNVSHPAPVRQADPETDKRAALKLAQAAAKKPDVAQMTRDNAVRFAAEQGAPVDEIAACTGLSEDTVRQVLQRD